ncbi:MAG TPA: DUF4032 domain-containing protein [Candidatus Limnocylindrales bacterium]
MSPTAGAPGPVDISRATAAAPFPQLRLRAAGGPLLDLPWELPLADWPTDHLQFRDLPVGPSRHLVRFLVTAETMYALKELPDEIAGREYDVLRTLEVLDLPAVKASGLAESPERDSAILITEYLRHSLQYRRLLARFPSGPGPHRDRLLDAMAWLLVDLHRSGVYWGDCSLANTLFRRDGDRIQAFLVDAETSEVHPSLSDGQRNYDLDVLVENVGFGLADLAAEQSRPEEVDDAIQAAESVRDRYQAVWDELHQEARLASGDRFAIRARVRRLNDLGFAVDEIEVSPGGNGTEMRLRVTVSNRRFHARELQRLTGLVALEGQARLLLNDLHEYAAWVDINRRRKLSEQEGADVWLTEVLQPVVDRLRPAIGPTRDPIQAYCDVLEEKWLLSERAGTDVGLEAAIAGYLSKGAPGPETGSRSSSDISLDLVGDVASVQDDGPPGRICATE